MCSSPKPPKMPEYEAPPMPEMPAPMTTQEIIDQQVAVNTAVAAAAPPAPAPAPTRTQQQAAPMPIQPPIPMAPTAPVPPPPVNNLQLPQAPPPALVNLADSDSAIIKKRKSKRKELQQASSGTDALRIPLNKGIGVASGGGGKTGLSIPS